MISFILYAVGLVIALYVFGSILAGAALYGSAALAFILGPVVRAADQALERLLRVFPSVERFRERLNGPTYGDHRR